MGSPTCLAGVRLDYHVWAWRYYCLPIPCLQVLDPPTQLVPAALVQVNFGCVGLVLHECF